MQMKVEMTPPFCDLKSPGCFPNNAVNLSYVKSTKIGYTDSALLRNQAATAATTIYYRRTAAAVRI